MAEEPTRGRRPIFVALAIFATVTVFAFAVEKTDVDLGEIQSESRRTQLFRIIRGLARPDLITYDQEDTVIRTAMLVPCNPAGPDIPEAQSGPMLVIIPPCATPGDEITIEGRGFPTLDTGQLTFVPDSEFDVTLNLVKFEADKNGDFTVTAEVPDRESALLQTVQATTRVPIGSWLDRADVWIDSNFNGRVDDGEMKKSPRASAALTVTLDKITETVMLALIATTVGTALAIPISFMAARNLMRDVSATLTNLGLTLIGLPVGVIVGVVVSRWARSTAGRFDNALVLLLLLAVIPWLLARALRWAIPEEDEAPPTRTERLQRIGVLIISVFVALTWAYLLGDAAQRTGARLQDVLGGAGFFGNFVSVIGEVLTIVLPVLSALIGMGALMTLGSRLGYAIRTRVSARTLAAVNYGVLAAAFAILALLSGSAVSWLYQIDNATTTMLIPAIVGAAFGLFTAFRTRKAGSVGTGLVTYYLARTVFNSLRSVEPLIMVIVFVVWVGIGPFAGSLALALHTTAALAKLYSEQVENISEGPLEAIRATGATRLQTVVYGVAPQIVPPYISFTMYRWDINVRLSTIIGFGGGGGIGFILQQNINLVQYRAASVNMLAIAIVVATLDYVSSRLRERFV